MAKLERCIYGNFDELLSRIQNGILGGSVSASMEDYSFFKSGEAKCTVMVFERYSYMGGNRVSLTVTLFQERNNAPIHLSGITAGGSQAMFFKMNTFGEEAFLEKLAALLD